MGKMISPQNIATGVSVTVLQGPGGRVFARTFPHSIVLTLVLGVLVAAQQYLIPWIIPGGALTRAADGASLMSEIAFPRPTPDPCARRRDPRGPGRRPPGGMCRRGRGRPARFRDRRADRLSPRCRSPSCCRAPPTRSRARCAIAASLASTSCRAAPAHRSRRRVPQEDAIVVGLSKMNRIVEINLSDRFARVEAGVTNLAISEAVGRTGFFYAPDPSSQLACTIGGNIAMNSGGAHCLKYGVTSNNLLGVRLVTFDGEIVDLGGPAPDAGGLDLLGLVCGAEGQLGIVTEAWVRILPMAEGSAPRVVRLRQRGRRRPLRRGDHRRGNRAGRDGIHGQARHRDHRELAHAGYPLDVEAMLIIESEGSPPEIDAELKRIAEIARTHSVRVVREIAVGDGERRRSGRAASRRSAPPAHR